MKSQRTVDRGPHEGQVMAVHTVHQIGPNRSLLPNGNLLCHSVPIARSGWLLYGPGEVPVKAGSNGIVYIERTADQLFNEKTMSSFNASAVTNDHPADDVTPLNWNGLAGGFALNVRQGTGDDADVLLADLMITNSSLIDAIQKGKVEVSAGYDADYEDLGGGMGRQSNILGNHIALVDKGRCGPRCAIGDQAYFVPPPPTKENLPMASRTPLRQPRVALVDNDAKAAARQKFNDAKAELDALEQEDGQEDDTGNHIHIHMPGSATNDAKGGDGKGKTMDAAVEERFVKLETTLDGIGETLKALLPGKTDDEMPEGLKKKKVKKDEDEDEDEKPRKKKTGDGDSAALESSYTELKAQSEILVPGFKTPTFDAEMTRASTVDRMCNVRRKVLDQFGTTDEGKAILLAANGGAPVDLLSLDCVGCAQLFKNASTAKAAINNMGTTRDAALGLPKDATAVRISSLPTPAEMNAAAKLFWEGK